MIDNFTFYHFKSFLMKTKKMKKKCRLSQLVLKKKSVYLFKGIETIYAGNKTSGLPTCPLSTPGGTCTVIGL